jgi:hypothetical protein
MRSPEKAFAWGAAPAEYLARQPGQFRVYSPSYSLPQHTAFNHGLCLADGVDPFQLVYYAEFLAQAGGYKENGYSASLPPDLTDTNVEPLPERLGLLNVAYIASAFQLEIQGLALATQEGGTFIYRNELVLPRAYVTSMASPAIESDISLRFPVVSAPADVVVHTPNRISIQAELTEPGLLVLAEVWYPGWQAQVDGTQVPIRRVEGALRGISLEAGTHTVEFEYSPWTVLVGLGLSGGTAFALLAFAAYCFSRHA